MRLLRNWKKMAGEDKLYVASVYVTASLVAAMIMGPIVVFLGLLADGVILVSPSILAIFACGIICARATIHAAKQAEKRVQEYD